jgi:hypothetical protein
MQQKTQIPCSNDLTHLFDDDTIDWQHGLAHVTDLSFDSIYNQNHQSLGQSRNHQQLVDSENQEQLQQSEDPDDTKVSDALTYGPRFCQLFREYTSTLNQPIDCDRHLMSLCTEHLVSFCKWARENDLKTASIRETLFEDDYLRPEVRNGIVMVLVYTFSAMKATREDGSNMFIILQDTERGLGIGNKFSLKIYNDPLMYLSFLKISISALIDAGSIPDNERLNQPKRSKKKNNFTVENEEELFAFDQIQRIFVSLLDNGDNTGAKNMVILITNYWQQQAKVKARLELRHCFGLGLRVRGNS